MSILLEAVSIIDEDLGTSPVTILSAWENTTGRNLKIDLLIQLGSASGQLNGAAAVFSFSAFSLISTVDATAISLPNPADQAKGVNTGVQAMVVIKDIDILAGWKLSLTVGSSNASDTGIFGYIFIMDRQVDLISIKKNTALNR